MHLIVWSLCSLPELLQTFIDKVDIRPPNRTKDPIDSTSFSLFISLSIAGQAAWQLTVNLYSLTFSAHTHTGIDTPACREWEWYKVVCCEVKICRARSGRDLRQIDRGRHSSAHLHVCALSSTHEYEVCTSSSLLTLLSLSAVCFKVDHNRCGQLCLVIAHFYLPAAYHHLPQTHRNLAYCTRYSYLLPLSLGAFVVEQ